MQGRDGKTDGIGGHRVFRRFRVVLTLVVLLLLGVGVVAGAHGYRVHVVRSGSMSPALNVGDLVISKRADVDAIRPGQIVSFADEAAGWRSVTHRVQKVVHQDGTVMVTTKGDGNKISEAWQATARDSVGVEQFRIPAIGRLLIEPSAWLALACLAIFVVSLAVIGWLVKMLVTGRGSATLQAWARSGAPRPRGCRVPRHLVRAAQTAGGVFAIGALFVTNGSTYGAWTAANANASNSFATSAAFPTTYTPSPANCTSMTQQTLAITAGQTLATVTVKGGDGGDGNGAGGNGGSITGTFAVANGQTLYIDVGCAGTGGSGANGGVGWAAGGKSGTETTGNAGSGGGASAICINTCATLTNIEFVGGGGGGGGGGASGGGTGGAGSSATTAATTTTVGTAYDGVAGSGGTTPGAGGLGGVFNAVGTGANGSNNPCCYGDGGGGGGGGVKGGTGGGATYFGGGGGAGGGSSWYKSGATFTSQTTNGSGNGSIIVAIS